MNARHPHAASRLLSGTVTVFLAEALLLPTGLLTIAFLTRTFGPVGFGQFSLAATLVTWIEWGITATFSRTAVKFVSEAASWRAAATLVLRFHLAVSCGAAGLLWLAAPRLAVLFSEPSLAGLLRLFAFDIPLFSLAHAHRHILIGIGDFRPRAFASAGRWVARLIFIVVLVKMGLSLPGAILGSIGASLVELIIARAFVRTSLVLRSPWPTREVISYAVPLLLAALSLRLFDRLDLFMLKLLGGTTAQVGIYAAAQNLTLAVGIFALAFSPLLLSSLSRMQLEGRTDQARMLGRDAMRVVIGLLPLVGVAAGAAPDIVRVAFGAAFLPGAPLLGILMFGALAMLMISVTMTILTAANKPTWALAATAPLAPLAVAGYVAVIPRFGALGAATVGTACATVGAVMTIVAVNRAWGIAAPLGTLTRSTMIGGAAYALALAWPAPGPMVLLKLAAVASFAVLAFVLCGEFSLPPASAARPVGGWRAIPYHATRWIRLWSR
jgi:O-antigen/teichoic acid export membrane protein